MAEDATKYRGDPKKMIEMARESITQYRQLHDVWSLVIPKQLGGSIQLATLLPSRDQQAERQGAESYNVEISFALPSPEHRELEASSAASCSQLLHNYGKVGGEREGEQKPILIDREGWPFIEITPENINTLNQEFSKWLERQHEVEQGQQFGKQKWKKELETLDDDTKKAAEAYYSRSTRRLGSSFIPTLDGFRQYQALLAGEDPIKTLRENARAAAMGDGQAAAVPARSRSGSRERS